MTTPFSAATAAYGQAQNLITQRASTTPDPQASQPAGGPDFKEMVAENVQNVVEQGNRTDQLTVDMVNGNANVVDVVTAVSETEMAIESIVTVRDKVIQAYEKIMRMPI